MNIPHRVFRTRLKAVREKLEKENIRFLILFSTGIAFGPSSRTHGYMRYLCNLAGSMSPNVLVLVPNRDPILLVSFPYLHSLATQTSWFEDVRFVPLPGIAGEIIHLIKPLAAKKEKIGYVGKVETPAPFYQELLEGIKDAEWVELDGLLDEMRIIKDEFQILFHRRVAEICDKMFETLSQEIRKGKKAFQLQADMEQIAKYEGSEYALCWLTVRRIADRPRFFIHDCSRVPQPGDQVLAGVMILYEGHWGHAVRTGVLGNPTRTHKKLFDIVMKMEEAALERLIPEKNLVEVQSAFEKVLRKYYPSAKALDKLRFRNAHGIGLDYEEPILTSLFPQPFLEAGQTKKPNNRRMAPIRIKPGMLFELHPNLFVPNVGGAAIGDMALVKEGGNEILTRFPRELISW